MNELFKDIDVFENLRGVGVWREDILKIVVDAQRPYYDYMSDRELTSIFGLVLDDLVKYHDVKIAVYVALMLDKLAEQNAGRDNAIIELMVSDAPEYGLDEHLALMITNHGGTIASTNFGHVDKVKSGIIGAIDDLGKDSDETTVTTHLDDVVGALASTTMGLATAYLNKY